MLDLRVELHVKSLLEIVIDTIHKEIYNDAELCAQTGYNWQQRLPLSAQSDICSGLAAAHYVCQSVLFY